SSRWPPATKVSVVRRTTSGLPRSAFSRFSRSLSPHAPAWSSESTAPAPIVVSAASPDATGHASATRAAHLSESASGEERAHVGERQRAGNDARHPCSEPAPTARSGREARGLPRILRRPRCQPMDAPVRLPLAVRAFNAGAAPFARWLFPLA